MCKVSRGQWIRQRIDDLGLSAGGLARATSLSGKTIGRVSAGGKLSPQVAALIARPLKLTPEALEALLRSDVVDENEMRRLLGEAEC